MDDETATNPDPESRFQSSEDELLVGEVRNAGCCSCGGIGGGFTITARGTDESDLFARSGLRGGGFGMIGMGGAAGIVDSYRKATSVSSLKAFNVDG